MKLRNTAIPISSSPQESKTEVLSEIRKGGVPCTGLHHLSRCWLDWGSFSKAAGHLIASLWLQYPLEGGFISFLFGIMNEGRSIAVASPHKRV